MEDDPRDLTAFRIKQTLIQTNYGFLPLPAGLNYIDWKLECSELGTGNINQYLAAGILIQKLKIVNIFVDVLHQDLYFLCVFHFK